MAMPPTRCNRCWYLGPGSNGRCARRALDEAENLIEMRRDPSQRVARIVEQVREAVEQVPEQVARARRGGDIEADRARGDLETQEVEVDRAEVEVQDGDRAGGRTGLRDRQRQWGRERVVRQDTGHVADQAGCGGVDP